MMKKISEILNQQDFLLYLKLCAELQASQISEVHFLLNKAYLNGKIEAIQELKKEILDINKTELELT